MNDEIVHGIPGKRRLNDGDIISVDVGVILDGFNGDSAWTYGVGTISPEATLLMEQTEEALMRAVAAAATGNRLGAIGHAVESYARPLGRGIVKDYGGHGIGRAMHMDPFLPNEGSPGRGPYLAPGSVLAIEPMLTLGTTKTVVLEDEWTVVTADGSRAAHWEHTVAVTEDGPRILTV